MTPLRTIINHFDRLVVSHAEATGTPAAAAITFRGTVPGPSDSMRSRRRLAR